jgi:hypothetical protein
LQKIGKIIGACRCRAKNDRGRGRERQAFGAVHNAFPFPKSVQVIPAIAAARPTCWFY